ncbi:hypothetical protein [Lutimonas sp.]|uniref:hypothetical protein n=1 Tax=Lutimonas sp. TaxID=1872403 RepID=UPI003D9B8854
MLEINKPEPRLISYGQRLFARYLTAILVDLVVLNLFVEYWDKVEIDSFTISVFAAILLQLMLRSFVLIEFKLANFINAQTWKYRKAVRLIASQQVLFWSKFVILGAIDIIFKEHVEIHGILAFFVVVITILVSESLIAYCFRLLNPKKKTATDD